jgi:PAS domain S-box-containing protein
MMHERAAVEGDHRPPRPEDLGLGPFFWVMRDAITVTSTTSPQIELLNPAAERMFGYTLADRPSWMTIVHPRDLPKMVEAFAPIWAGQSSQILDTTAPFEATYVRKDGQERVLNAFADVLTEQSTGRQYVVGICRDVTEQLVEREARGRLDGVMLAARELAHQLNNRLAIALADVEFLRSPLDSPLEPPELLADIVAQLEGAAQAVVQLQRVIRVETKATPAGPALDLTRSTLCADAATSH